MHVTMSPSYYYESHNVVDIVSCRLVPFQMLINTGIYQIYVMGVDGQFDWKLTIESVRLIKNSKKKKKRKSSKSSTHPMDRSYSHV